MKLIIAIIQPHKLEEVKAELNSQKIERLTVSDVQGYGRQKGKTEVYRGHEYQVNLIRKVRLEIAVNDDFVKPTIDAILKSARTEGGKIGDGKIFVLPLENVIRIRTGETGEQQFKISRKNLFLTIQSLFLIGSSFILIFFR